MASEHHSHGFLARLKVSDTFVSVEWALNPVRKWSSPYRICTIIVEMGISRHARHSRGLYVSLVGGTIDGFSLLAGSHTHSKMVRARRQGDYRSVPDGFLKVLYPKCVGSTAKGS